MTLKISKNTTPIVVVFIPPPVEPGEAPMNMSITVMNLEASVIAPWSIVLKPAVLGAID